MATYYVRKTGSDGAAGTSAGAAWQTIGKALGATGIASGDTVYVGSGTYREVVTVAMTSATVETRVVADIDGSQTGDAGPVVWTAYTTNDTTAPSASLIGFAGRDYLTFEDFVLIGGTGTPIEGYTTTHPTNITFRRCAIKNGGVATSSNNLVGLRSTGRTTLSWLFDKCILEFSNNGFYIETDSTGAATDWDVDVKLRNCLLIGTGYYAIYWFGAGGGTGRPYGLKIRNCSFYVNGQALQIDGEHSAVTLSFIYNSLIQCHDTALGSFASGRLTENYNVIRAATPRTNVTAGANSVTGNAYAPTWSVGQEALQGFGPRSFLSPMAGSTLLGFGNDGTETESVDALNRPRPAGGGSTSKGVGYLERHDTATQETTTVDAGSSGLVIVGPGDHDIRIPVDAASTTITIRGRFDTTHATTNRPQAILLANTKIGVTTETKTMTAAVDTWETLTFSAFTPTAKGVVTIRLVSRSAGGGGKAFWDTLAVA